MAAKSYESGYKKHYGQRLANISHDTTEEQIKKVYQDWASQYEKEVISSARAVRHKPLAECLDDAIKQAFHDRQKYQLKIIDAGAGTGLMGVELDKLGYTDLHALDISQEMLTEARKKNLYKNFICAPLSDQRIPEIETGEFDALVCAGVLVKGHVRSSAFGEMVRMVKSGGLLCFNIRDSELDDYQPEMLELEKERKWEKICQKTVPLYDSEDMPKETLAFIYRRL